jgi:hypothetical protein
MSGCGESRWIANRDVLRFRRAFSRPFATVVLSGFRRLELQALPEPDVAMAGQSDDNQDNSSRCPTADDVRLPIGWFSHLRYCAELHSKPTQAGKVSLLGPDRAEWTITRRDPAWKTDPGRHLLVYVGGCPDRINRHVV